MYELFILGQLMIKPVHGYLIARIINDMIGPFARVSNGRLYPLLAKLESAGLIEVYTESNPGPVNDRQLRTYRITETGKRRFHDLMTDTTSSPGEYQKLFIQKVGFLYFLQPDERLYLIEHYINYCQAHVLHLRAEADDFMRHVSEWGPEWSQERAETNTGVMQHYIDQWQLELDWAKHLRAKELNLQANNSFLEHLP